MLTSDSNIPNNLVTLRRVENLIQVDVLELRPNDSCQVELLKDSKAPDSFNGTKGPDLEATASTPLKAWKALGACV